MDNSKSKIKKVWRLAMVLTMVILLSGGCIKKQQDKVIRVAFFPNITHAQALVIKDQHMLENALGTEYQVKWLDFNAGPSEIEAFYAGEVDIGYIGPVPAVTAHQNSQGEIRIAAGAANGGSVLVCRPDLEIDSSKQLAELTVAIPKLGNTQHLLLLKVLSEAGLSPVTDGGNVNVIAVNNADMVSAMDQGRIDAALVPEPWGSTLQSYCDARIVLDYRDIWMDGDYATTVVISSNDFLKKNEELARIFMKVHQEATEYILTNKEEAKEIVNRQIEELTGQKLDMEILNEAYERISVTDQVSEQSIFDYARLSLDEGFIQEMPGEELIDNYLQQD